MPRIEDYALLSDCQSAALVSRDGSIDWLCLPRFDSDACFAALLGGPENGRWLLRPKGDVKRTTRKYLDDTMVLETVHETSTGSVAVLDLMPVRGRAPDVVRIVCGRSGTVRMQMELTIRFGYGQVVPWVTQVRGGIQAIAGPDLVRLITPVKTHGKDLRTLAEFEVGEGDRVPFVLTWYPSNEPQPDYVDAEDALKETEERWRKWAAKCTLHGPHEKLVRRSLITLKGLAYAPTGGIVAAPTTSLPEQLGGVRNWDYRYCWLRDSTFTLFALMSAGYTQEASRWRDWLLRAVAGNASQLQIMYGLAGERRLTEQEIPWLAGYEGSKPVRIGNAASGQLQLDVYGEVMDSLYHSRRVGLAEEDASWDMQSALLAYLEKIWDQPDEGLWEVRGGRRHFVHSKVMAWVAFDRAVKMVDQFGLDGPIDHWRELRDRVHASVMRDGFDEQLGAFVQSYGSKELDASVLLLPLVGFIRADDPRMVSTVKVIEKKLRKDGFVARYSGHGKVDGLPGNEGAFLACSFWLADNYILQGREADARELFERLVGLANDVGLLAEEYDPEACRMVGNFPQAFSHVALVNTVLNLQRTHGPARHRRM